MSDPFRRVSALDGVAIQGRFGADRGAPGVTLSVAPPGAIVTVIARKGKARALAEALKGYPPTCVQWAGDGQYFIIGEDFAAVARKLERVAACSGQSHGRVVIRIAGPKVRLVLAKGSPVDFHESEFAIGMSALTQMAHVGVHVTRTAEDSFELSVFRGFSESFWEWLCLQAEEYGYQVV